MLLILLLTDLQLQQELQNKLKHLQNGFAPMADYKILYFSFKSP